MDRKEFYERSGEALEHIESHLAELDVDRLDVELAGDVLTLSFVSGLRFVINAHSAAGQIWMAAGTDAWHFDFDRERAQWVAPKNGDELMATTARVVGAELGRAVEL